MAEEDRIAKLEAELQSLESRINFRILSVAVGALIATLLALYSIVLG